MALSTSKVSVISPAIHIWLLSAVTFTLKSIHYCCHSSLALMLRQGGHGEALLMENIFTDTKLVYRWMVQYSSPPSGMVTHRWKQRRPSICLLSPIQRSLNTEWSWLLLPSTDEVISCSLHRTENRSKSFNVDHYDWSLREWIRWRIDLEWSLQNNYSKEWYNYSVRIALLC